ncbi:MAG: metal ABC transporter ATP-binding protein [Acidobacteriota bacterium]
MNRIKAVNKCSLCCTKINDLRITAGSDVILDDVNMHFHCGELTGLIGPNGAGKTTLLKAILGEVPFAGSISYLDASDRRTGRPIVGYVPQVLDFDKNSPASVFDYCASCISWAPVWLLRPRSVRDKVLSNLSRVKAEYLIDRRIGLLSGGELQRVLLACALDPVPNLLLLDEPVSGVDVQGMDLFYKMVSDLRCDYDLSVLMVSHDINLLSRYADRIVLLNKTVLAQGPPNEVLNGHQMLHTFGACWHLEEPREPAAAVHIHHPKGEQ